MPVAGRLELTIKINEFPADVQTVENGWKQFEIDCDGRLITIKVKPKVFKKLEQAQENYPMWVAAIAGKMGEPIDDGFMLDQPTIQVFERKPKEPKEPQEAATTAAS
ncbi:MAG TPA: fertility inhibition FinO-like protein [Cyanophyceae cyanobacterium]